MITMEKIDYVMNITGASYEVVRVALLDADGDVDRAIKIIMHSVVIPEKKEDEKKDFINFDEIKNAIKEIWDKGNASKIIVSKDDEIVLSLPLTVSALGLVLAPLAALVGAGVVLVTDYDFKVIMDSGEIIDLKEYINIKKFSKKSSEEKSESEDNNSQNTDDSNNEDK
ncbi:DUF4342 domain-containing protein [Peptoniphilus stercorisuis]|uniref:NACalpha-BTF3-like transcription factor n=1 Tax=Peptoniphilus stercorisuis TaxID=1436965 RepID=A0ABS4KD38_9FIRM|nr:DUF4342 domain-containing protein [Peptoniphilus stercorisuis]MBP2025275.1 NACalpha-BTF3-like transcription factor [Peptoniphilus stercorisuis]